MNARPKGFSGRIRKNSLPGDYVEIDILDEVSLTANISAYFAQDE